jgi:hypothetical protein
MLTCMMGFPAGLYTGFPLMSSLELLAAAAALSAVGTAVGYAALGFGASGFAGAAAAAAGGIAAFGRGMLTSPDAVRWGMFRMSLYRGWLLARSVGRIFWGAAHTRHTYGGGAGVEPSFFSVMISMSC